MSENPFTKAYWLGKADPRPLALFRLLFGSVMLVDLASRIRDVRASFSDEGFAPRDAVTGLNASWSLFRLAGSPSATMALYLMGMAAALAFVVGYRTRLAQLAMYVFVGSLHFRNPWIVGYGPDILMGSMCFWLLFTDAGAVWSVDWILRRRPVAPVAALGLRLLQWQLALVFFFASIAKWTSWGDGLALYRILQVRAITLPLGAALLAWPSLCFALTRSVPWIELTVPLLLIPLAPLSPRWFRAVGIAAGAALFLGILSTLRVAYFAELMLSSLSLFVLPEWLDRLGLGPRAEDGPDQAPADAPPGWKQWLPLGLGTGQLFLVICSLVWQIGRHSFNEKSLLHLELRQMNLAQRWGMFSEVRNYSDMWWSGRGTLADGSQQEILASTFPEIADQTVPDIWWEEVRRRMEVGNSKSLRRLIANYVCREFNRTASQPVVALALGLHMQRVMDPNGQQPPGRVRIFNEKCGALEDSDEELRGRGNPADQGE